MKQTILIYMFLVAWAILLTMTFITGCGEKATQEVIAPRPVDQHQYSPYFPDSTRLVSDDYGQTWYYEANAALKKLAGCTCECQVSNSGIYPGGCTYGGRDYSCNDWCGHK